ncbi:MAG: hemolysin family protein [Hyphomicrobiales bacterium]
MNDDPSRPSSRPDSEQQAARPDAAAGDDSQGDDSQPGTTPPDANQGDDGQSNDGQGDDSQGGVTDWLKGLFGRGPDESERETDNGAGPETARPEAGSMMRNLLEFVDLRVEDVMVPRAEIVAVDENASVHELLSRFMEANHSRLPIYRETLDDPVGMVHIKDFLRWLTERHGEPGERGAASDRESAKNSGKNGAKNGGKKNGSKNGGKARPAEKLSEAAVILADADLETTVKQTAILRPLLFVPPSMRAADLLVKMQSTRSHMAIVVDEYGGTDGLVSIEDLVEEIVGDIADEHDEDEAELITPAEDGVFLADARAPIEDVEELLGLSLLPEEREEDADSLGGLIVSMLGRVPVRGELLRHPAGIELEILEADPRRVRKIRIHTRPKPQRQRRKEPGGQS